MNSALLTNLQPYERYASLRRAAKALCSPEAMVRKFLYAMAKACTSCSAGSQAGLAPAPGQSDHEFSQNCGEMPKYRPRRRAVSAVTPRLRPRGDLGELRVREGERRTRIRSGAAARHPTRRHAGGRLEDVRPGRQGGPWAGKTLEQQARERGYTYLTQASDLAGVRQANQDAPVLGLFSPGNMPVKFTELLATSGGAACPRSRAR